MITTVLCVCGENNRKLKLSLRFNREMREALALLALALPDADPWLPWGLRREP